jgi:hypothetical protein
MRPQEEFLKRDLQKKKKRKSRFVRFMVFLVLLLIVITLIFIAISNPGFFNEVKKKFSSFYSSEESLQTGSGETLLDGESSPSDEQAGATNETIEQDSTGGQTEGAGSFWQKIIDFFKSKMQSQSDDFPSTLKLKCYFASLGQEKKFVYEERTISAGSAKIAVENAVKELLKGPIKTFHYPVVPPGTELISVEIYENIAKIDFSQEFLEKSLESGILDEYVIYTLVNTVTQVPGIEGVIFLIEGKRIKVYGNVDLSIPAIMNEKYLNIQE